MGTENSYFKFGLVVKYQNILFKPSDCCPAQQLLNCLANNKILAWTKLKSFAEDIFNVAKMMISDFDKVGNIVGKGENAGYLHCLLFPLYFQQASSSGSLKPRILW